VSSTSKITVCVLTYGDHPEYLERCLSSIFKTVALEQLNLRIAMNSPSDRVRDWIYSWADMAYIYDSPQNILKYPLMRKMFYDDPAIDTPYVMWFDDDSYLSGYEIESRGDAVWLPTVEEQMTKYDLIGAPFVCNWAGNQQAWVKQQPWYLGKPLRSKMHFCVGGWWCANMDLIRRANYPWPELIHNGGDTMLGEMAYQQNWRIGSFRSGVVINADFDGKEAQAPRRGFSEKKPLGA
jgi:GT2 family glycosyltransferase